MRILLTIYFLFITSIVFSNVLECKTANFTYKIDTNLGGRIVSMVGKDGKEWVGEGNGILMDLAVQQPYSTAELLHKPYSYEIKDSENNTVVTLNSMFSSQIEKTITGIEITKEITFNKNTDIVNVNYKLKNPTNENRKIGFWVQNIVNPSSGKFRTTYRPSTRGTLKYTHPADGVVNLKNDFCFNFVGGWIAVLNPENTDGLVFLTDYNYTKCIYANLGAYTQEWWYDDILIRPNSSFDTSVKFVPIKNLNSVDYASRNYIVSSEITRNGSNAVIKVKTLSNVDYKNKKIKIVATKYPEKMVISEKEGTLSGVLSENSLAIDNLNSKDDIIYNIYYPDTKESFEIFSPGVAILFSETTYLIKAPKKVKNIVKPDLKVRIKNNIPNLLHLRGLFSEHYKLDEVCKYKGFNYKEGYYFSNDMGAGASNFPEDYDEMFKYDLIVINHVPANAFNEDKWNMLYDYVKYGGNILFIGGPMCITGYDAVDDASNILLPFSYDKFSKLKRYKNGSKLDNVGIYEYSTLVPTKSLDKIKPYLYSKSIGSGKIYIFTPLVLSQNYEKEGFWNKDNYIKFMSDLLTNLSGENK